MLSARTGLIPRSAIAHGTRADQFSPRFEAPGRRWPQGALWHSPGHRWRPRDGRSRCALRSFGPEVGRGPGPGGHAGRSSAHGGQLRALLHDLSSTSRPRRAGQSDDIRGLIRWVIKSTEKPLVIDADGLNTLAVQPELLSGLTRAVVVTPHPGEFARLTGTDVAAVQADRIGNAARFAARSEQLIVVLKGAGTVVTDGHRVYVNRTGNPGMATGGAGDVLTGVIAALIGQRLPAFDAAQLGVYIHGLAGDIARDQSGTVGMIAGDILDSLPDAFDHATMKLEPEAGL